MSRGGLISAVAGLLALLLGTDAVSAQTSSPAPPQAGQADEAPLDITSEIELTRAAIQVRRQAIVTAAMDLEPKEADAFWPLYRLYRADMAKVNDRYVKLLVTYTENYDTLSDQLAARIMGDYLGVERDRTGVKARYVPRFRKIMPARKVMRFFQVDNKLDAIINAELAAEIPLAR
jgi:hypothetical protein